MQDNVATAFPIGTMAVNILGCFLIGLFYAMLEKMHIMNPDLRLFLTVGFCGGFTTFSTFMNESMSLFRADNLLMGALYIGGSVALGMIAVVAGAKIMTF
jgi:CrcB protein